MPANSKHNMDYYTANDFDPISATIWDAKYRLKDKDGFPIDQVVEDTWSRVAKDLASVDLSYEDEFYEAMKDFKFLPAGRIVAGAGSNRSVTMFNCFVMGTVPDSLGGIFDMLKEAALTMQQGGGIGYDFSTIRPQGAEVKGVASDASGPLTFMDVWDASCRTIMSAGSRRGAMMATMRCDHPDVGKFIKAKQDAIRLRMFNLSVLVTDPFMAAVKANGNWDLVFDGKVYETVKALDLWNQIMNATFNYAEPGVIFIDRINRMNNLNYVEQIAATNPCFTADTKVWTEDGAKSFEDLVGQDVKVLTQNDEGRFEMRLMTKIRKTQRDAELVEVVFRNDTRIRCTPNHIFYAVDGEEIEAQNLGDGMEIRSVIDYGAYMDASVVTVHTVNPLDEREDVYCGSVAGLNRFFIVDDFGDGILVHNCGEQPLPPYGACLLGSVNLARLVVDPFTKQARLDEAALAKLVRTAIRMMDNVIDVSRFPLPQQEKEAKAKRRIGLGVTGLADALLMVQQTYGTEEAALTVEGWMKLIARESYLASVDIAKVKGSFPLFNAEKYLASGNMMQMDDDVREEIRKHGIRNALLTSIAPTGTISIYAGNVSSGVEPVFAYSYTRKVRQPDGGFKFEQVEDYAVSLYYKMFGRENPLPDYFVNAQTLSPLSHVRMQAAAQKWIDSSISKTINCPEDISFEDFKEVYMAAWDQGCKGCTTYRPNDVTGSVLTSTDAPKPVETPAETSQAVQDPASEPVSAVLLPALTDRPGALSGATYKLKWPGGEHAIYITINNVVVEGAAQPFEIFINSKDVEHFAWITAMTRMISAVFRRGGDISFVVEELKAVFDPRGGAWVGGKYVPSMIAAIGGVIEKHIQDFSADPAPVRVVEVAEAEAPVAAKKPGKPCPSCGEYTLVVKEGCLTCSSCGHSKCG